MKKWLMIACVVVAVVGMALSACGGTMCSGSSASVKIDLATDMRTHTVATSEAIRYSTGWGNSLALGATAVVAVNGEMLNSATGNGVVDWTPIHNGTYTLTHKVMLDNVQIGETLTATFVVLGPDAPVFSPVSGTIFDTATLSVSISCPTDGAVIYYTTDGSEPTTESPEYRRFRISGKTTVKAIAKKNGLLSDVATAEYALGQCGDPVITPNDGATFEWAGEPVAISWQGEDGVLRYTTDGSDPTRESPVYEGPFTLCDSTIVKAKVFSDNFFDSTVVTANIARVWTDVAIPQIEAADSFTGSKTKVVISCATDGASIRYTLDGSTPDSNSDVYAGPFYVTDSCTVKAYAMKFDYRDSAVATREIIKVWIKCTDPVIVPSNGSVFEWAGEQVSINWQGEGGVLHYTTDGSDPTRESPVYEEPFTINDSTIVKAKAFSDCLFDSAFDSAVVTANITRVWMDVAMPQIEAADSFTGSKTKVVISCATVGAAIRYTLDGSEPDSNSDVYTGPFYVTDSCTIKAYAVKYDYRDSAVATQEVVKVWDIGDTMGKPDHVFMTDGRTGWMRAVDATAPNGEAMKSGAITHNQQSVLETTVTGPGTLTFSWRTSCEDSGGQYDWDHAEFAVDGTVLLWRDGINSWTNESVRIESVGEHTVAWTYKKDNVESDGDDAAYVAGYDWTSDFTETQTTVVPVPYVWLTAHDPGVADEYEAYENSAKATAANGFNKVWECYVAGISPTNETAKFTAAIEMVDGVPQITWSPDLNTNGVERTYTIWGKTNLTDEVEWECPTNSAHRFFKVTVDMP